MKYLINGGYGVHGESNKFVYHQIPKSSNRKELSPINPITNMIVVCSNCHSMLQRKKDQVIDPDEIKANY